MSSTKLHLHLLRGCAPAPLAHYLKALAVLRLVTQQAGDAQARGAWRNGHFVLATRLDRAELERFFLFQYAPSPLLDPWNNGSGFFQKVDKGIDPIEKSSAPRFAPLRDGISQVRTLLEQFFQQNPGKDIKFFKLAFQREFRNVMRGGLQEWFEAALVINEDLDAKYPALLGTGGNDGRLDFCNNFLQRLSGLFDTTSPTGNPLPQSAALLSTALFGDLGQGLSKKAAIGQFLPGGAGGANSTNGPDGDSLLNAWDFVLMLEGTLLFASAATRRMATNAGGRASAPFVLSSHAIGYPGANPNEEGGRGEQWMPLWDAPMTLAELRALLAEGRAQTGTKPAERPLDAARAIARLGVARGLTGFQRYGYLERNGQANLAVPLSLIEVRARPQARLIDDLADWLDRLRRTARDKGAPSRLQQAERMLADAVFGALTHDAEPTRWQGVLRAAVQIEDLQSAGTGIAAGPIPELNPEWLSACDDGSPTFRLAACLGGTWAPKLGEKGRSITLRGFWLPLDPFARFKTSDKRLLRDPHVVCWGRDGVADAIALQHRLSIEATAQGERTRTLRTARGLGARLSDVASLLSGDTLLEDVLELARAFMAIRWKAFDARLMSMGPSHETSSPPSAWCALKLLFSPAPAGLKWTLPADPTVLRRLEAGELAAALKTTLDRLRPLGLVPTLHTSVIEPAQARLWAASLLFPLEDRALSRACSILDPSFDVENVTMKETVHADD